MLASVFGYGGHDPLLAQQEIAGEAAEVKLKLANAEDEIKTLKNANAKLQTELATARAEITSQLALIARAEVEKTRAQWLLGKDEVAVAERLAEDAANSAANAARDPAPTTEHARRLPG